MSPTELAALLGGIGAILGGLGGWIARSRIGGGREDAVARQLDRHHRDIVAEMREQTKTLTKVVENAATVIVLTLQQKRAHDD